MFASRDLDSQTAAFYYIKNEVINFVKYGKRNRYRKKMIIPLSNTDDSFSYFFLLFYNFFEGKK